MADKERRYSPLTALGDGALLLCALLGLTGSFLSLYRDPDALWNSATVLDRFGGPELLDQLLDKLLGLSRALLDVQRPHAVLWLDGAGEPQLHVISDEREYAECVLALLNTPAPLTGPNLDDRPELLHGSDGPVFRIHVDPEGGGGHG